ncbi:MAG: ATP-binding protein [Streptosporangiaceae bacterium]
MDRLMPDRAAPVASVPAGQVVASGGLVCADDLPDGIVIADQAGRVVVFNQAATRLTGIGALNALGRDIRQVLPFRDIEGRSWWACVDPYRGLSTRTRHPELPLFLPDGTEFLVTMGYVRVPRGQPGMDWPSAGEGGAADGGFPPRQRPRGGPGGRPTGLAQPGTVQRIAVSLRGTQQRVRLERSRADLVSTVAHELRSPLTSVKGFTATLLAKWTRFTDDQKRVMLETVNADADRVTRLITELLDVSRIEAGRIEIHRQLVDIPQRAEKIVAGRAAAGDPPERFRIEVPADLPETWLDADKVDQILGNLVENAVRHGAGTVTIVVQPADDLDPRTASRAGAQGAAGALAPAVAVSVRDEGDGVPPELVPRIFRQFWRAKRRGGAGLGLYIVKGLVEAHGGSITVQRAPGGGAEFRFTMPAGLPDFG